jgi:predicted exporter
MRRGLILVSWLAMVLFCLWVIGFRASISTDPTQFLPNADLGGGIFADIRASPAARMILIALSGDTEEARAAVSQDLADRLRATGRFRRVANSAQSLGAQGLGEDIQRQIFPWRYLLSPEVHAQRFTISALEHALRNRLHDLQSPLSMLEKKLIPADPTGEFLVLLRQWQKGRMPSPTERAGVWTSADTDRALLLAETRASGYDLAEQTNAIQTIRDAFSQAHGTSTVELALSGASVLAVSARSLIQEEATRLSLLAAALIIVLLFAAYRSARVVILCFGLVFTTMIAATATSALIFGSLHSITLAFGITLLGSMVDYPIHFFSHLRANEPPSCCLQRIWPTLRLCALTTAIGYVPMITPSFMRLSQLALFSIVALLTSALVTRFVLPELLPRPWRVVAMTESPWAAHLLRTPGPRTMALPAVILVVSLAVLVAKPPRWENNLAALSPLPREMIEQERRLRADLGAPDVSQALVIHARSAEAVLQLSEEVSSVLEALVREGTLSAFEAPSDILPSQRTQRARQAALPDAEELRRNLQQATAGLPFQPGLFEPFVNAVKEARTASPVTPDDVLATPLGPRLGALLFSTERGWTGLVTLAGVTDPERIANAIALLRTKGVRYVNVRMESERMLTEFRDAALDRLAWCAVALVVGLWIGLRSLRRVVAVLIPIILALVVDVSVLALLDEQLSLFHLVSFLLVIGIGIDYSLFFSHAGIYSTERRCTLHAMLLCAGTTVAGFGVLSFSGIVVLQAIGSVVVIGVVASFFFAVVLVPYLGWSRLQPNADRPNVDDRR